MKIKFFAKYLLASFAFFSFLYLTGTSVLANTRRAEFKCQPNSNNGHETIAVAVETGKKTPPIITWEIMEALDWQPQERCAVVSQRLNDAYVEFNYQMRKIILVPGMHKPFPFKDRNYSLPVICYTSNPQGSCQSNGDNILVTILGGKTLQDAKIALGTLKNRLEDAANRKGEDQPPLRQSGITEITIPLDHLNLGVDIESFLDLGIGDSPSDWEDPFQ
ncbi:COP23 domain-containing protein [Moorena sp. SIO3I6]|uniref:COP23 domain-containing protein n=1 Tax=Moorena sp. SIO3I6 TaxID=2607831 RepID=UPI0013FCB9DA|nr:COP23 domain-containing protein [Moorena sp. SIO3I6]NEP21616.1 hypothetical protein [Moorena sp. SIO3I6]